MENVMLIGIAGSQRDYIHWLLGVSTGNKSEPGDILMPEAIEMLATKLRTPLQVQLHLTLALDAGYQTGEKPVTAAMVPRLHRINAEDNRVGNYCIEIGLHTSGQSRPMRVSLRRPMWR